MNASLDILWLYKLDRPDEVVQEAPWVWLYALVLERFWHPETCQVLQHIPSFHTIPVFKWDSVGSPSQFRMPIHSYLSQFLLFPSPSYPALCPTRLFYGLCIFAANLFHLCIHPGQGALSQSQELASRRSQRKNCGICVTWLHRVRQPCQVHLPFSAAIMRLSRAAAASLLGAMAPKVDAIESWHGEGLADEICCKGVEVLEVLEATKKE